MHVYLGCSSTEGTGHCLERGKGSSGGINPSTVTERYSRPGVLKEQETCGLKTLKEILCLRLGEVSLETENWLRSTEADHNLSETPRNRREVKR